MNFGKRPSARDRGLGLAPVAGHAPAPAMQQTCVRCYGTGWVRERGNKNRCQACKGTGRVAAEAKRDSD
jgi:DnaJ-class molecular chaperone